MNKITEQELKSELELEIIECYESNDTTYLDCLQCSQVNLCKQQNND